MGVYLSNRPDHTFRAAQMVLRELHDEVWIDRVRTEHPSCCDQHHSAAGWKIMVVLAGRLFVPDLCGIWVLYRLCQADSLAQSVGFINRVPVCDPLPEHSYVLLVAAGPDQPPAVVCVRGAVRY